MNEYRLLQTFAMLIGAVLIVLNTYAIVSLGFAWYHAVFIGVGIGVILVEGDIAGKHR